MKFENITPKEAFQKMKEEGCVYLDVRTEEEFEEAHAKGAINIPIFLKTPQGRQFNPEFLSQVKKQFPKNVKLVVGCHSGGRSSKACELLCAEGYLASNIDGGFGGRKDPTTGEVAQEGWQAEGLPCE